MLRYRCPAPAALSELRVQPEFNLLNFLILGADHFARVQEVRDGDVGIDLTGYAAKNGLSKVSSSMVILNAAGNSTVGAKP